MTKQKKFRNILLSIFAIFFCLLVIEFGFRIFYTVNFKYQLNKAYKNPEIPEINSTVFFGEMIRPSPYQGISYELKPNLYVMFKNVSVKTNSKGWREEIISEKDENTTRIVGIGDSFMFGWGVERPQRYMDVLENKLNEEYNDKNYETVVFAVPGYNLRQEVEALQKYGLSFEPDIIIYGYVNNDDCLPQFINPTQNLLTSESMFLKYVRAVLNNQNLLPGFNKKLLGRDQKCNLKEIPKNLRQQVGDDSFLKTIEKLSDIGKKEEIPILVVYHQPFRYDVEGIYYVNSLINYSDSAMVLSEIDKHPSVEGHKYVAGKIYDFMLKEQII